MNIFFIETPTKALDHGVGSYAKNLLHALSSFPSVNLFYIQIGFAETGFVKRTKVSEHYSIIKIMFERTMGGNDQEVIIYPVVAKGLFCILSKYLMAGNNVFHLNSLLQRSVADLAVEYNHRVIFTQHVSLWRVFYNNNKQKFELEWNGAATQGSNPKFLKSIKWERDLCLVSDKVICLSRDAYQFSQQFYALSECKLVFVPNGVLPVKETTSLEQTKRIKKSLGFKKDDFVFLFVGRLIEQKGLVPLINAFKLLAANNSNVRLLFVGGGPELDKFISMAASLCGRISFTGYIEQDKVNAYYDIADVGIMPSVTEQSSFVVLEMLSKKLPMILSDINAFDDFISGVHAEKVRTNDNGYVYVDLLYKAMKHLSEDALYRERIAQSGYQLFLDQYQANTMAEKTYNVYKEIIAEASLK